VGLLSVIKVDSKHTVDRIETSSESLSRLSLRLIAKARFRGLQPAYDYFLFNLDTKPTTGVLASSLVILRQLFQLFPLFRLMTKNHQPNLLPFHQIKQLVRAGTNRFGVRVAPIVR
jgi:hypothetical protein